MVHTNYGYAIGLEKCDRLKLEHLLSFSGKNFIDFFYNKMNYNYIKKELKDNGWIKTYDKTHDCERELIYEKNNKKIFIYL